MGKKKKLVGGRKEDFDGGKLAHKLQQQQPTAAAAAAGNWCRKQNSGQVDIDTFGDRQRQPSFVFVEADFG